MKPQVDAKQIVVAVGCRQKLCLGILCCRTLGRQADCHKTLCRRSLRRRAGCRQTLCLLTLCRFRHCRLNRLAIIRMATNYLATRCGKLSGNNLPPGIGFPLTSKISYKLLLVGVIVREKGVATQGPRSGPEPALVGGPRSGPPGNSAARRRRQPVHGEATC